MANDLDFCRHLIFGSVCGHNVGNDSPEKMQEEASSKCLTYFSTLTPYSKI
jgi:hypothetical protein